jgi:hypothetical protein
MHTSTLFSVSLNCNSAACRTKSLLLSSGVRNHTRTRRVLPRGRTSAKRKKGENAGERERELKESHKHPELSQFRTLHIPTAKKPKKLCPFSQSLCLCLLCLGVCAYVCTPKRFLSTTNAHEMWQSAFFSVRLWNLEVNSFCQLLPKKNWAKLLRIFLSFFLLRPALNLLDLKLWSSSLALGRAFALPVELPATGAAAAAAGASSSPSRVLPPAAIIPGRPITNLK